MRDEVRLETAEWHSVKASFYSRHVKRPMDFVFSLFSIIFLSPVLIVVAVLVKLKLGSPVIFKQKRPGLNEKIFTLYKFRTMTETKEDDKLLPDEARLTKFGRLLRSTSMDELPELFNILNGDMSFVGPRPLLVRYLSLYNEEQKKRHHVRPGLTGLAMSKGRNALSWDQKFTYDTFYAGHVSFLLDLKIILCTLKIVIKRKGINETGRATVSEFRGSKPLTEVDVK